MSGQQMVIDPTSITSNDALGGSGSVPQSLWDVVVNGLNKAIDGKLSQKYPLASFNNTITTTADGQVKPRAAPQQTQSGAASVVDFFKTPAGIAVGVSVLFGVGVLIFAVARR